MGARCEDPCNFCGDHTLCSLDPHAPYVHCPCEKGYFLHSSGYCRQGPCTRLPNPCDSKTSFCNATNYDSFECTCLSGYARADSNDPAGLCVNIDDCIKGACEDKPNQVSIDGIGHFKCECASGFRRNMSSQMCQDIDECDENTNICGALRCTNLYGTYNCSCSEGFVLEEARAGALASCRDINECELEQPCMPGVQCKNMEPGFNCSVCIDGHYGDPARGCFLPVDSLSFVLYATTNTPMLISYALNLLVGSTFTLIDLETTKIERADRSLDLQTWSQYKATFWLFDNTKNSFGSPNASSIIIPTVNEQLLFSRKILLFRSLDAMHEYMFNSLTTSLSPIHADSTNAPLLHTTSFLSTSLLASRQLKQTSSSTSDAESTTWVLPVIIVVILIVILSISAFYFKATKSALVLPNEDVFDAEFYPNPLYAASVVTEEKKRDENIYVDSGNVLPLPSLHDDNAAADSSRADYTHLKPDEIMTRNPAVAGAQVYATLDHTKVRDMMTPGWSHPCDRKRAEELLQNAVAGTFVVRARDEAYAVSVVGSNLQVRHFKLQYTNYHWQIGPTEVSREEAKSLGDCINCLVDQPDWVYQRLGVQLLHPYQTLETAA